MCIRDSPHLVVRPGGHQVRVTQGARSVSKGFRVHPSDVHVHPLLRGRRQRRSRHAESRGEAATRERSHGSPCRHDFFIWSHRRENCSSNSSPCVARVRFRIRIKPKTSYMMKKNLEIKEILYKKPFNLYI